MIYQERKKHAQSFLGKTVKIIVDRPLGSVHPKYKNIIYSVNYGYIPNVLGGDGEEIDVYLLGVDIPVSEYTCKIIAVVHREDDEEDKLIGAPESKSFCASEIAEKIYFQEKYFNTHIETIYKANMEGRIK